MGLGAGRGGARPHRAQDRDAGGRSQSIKSQEMGRSSGNLTTHRTPDQRTASSERLTNVAATLHQINVAEMTKIHDETAVLVVPVALPQQHTTNFSAGGTHSGDVGAVPQKCSAWPLWQGGDP